MERNSRLYNTKILGGGYLTKYGGGPRRGTGGPVCLDGDRLSGIALLYAASLLSDSLGGRVRVGQRSTIFCAKPCVIVPTCYDLITLCSKQRDHNYRSKRHARLQTPPPGTASARVGQAHHRAGSWASLPVALGRSDALILKGNVMPKARKMLVLALRQAEREMIEAQAHAWRCRHLPDPHSAACDAHHAERLRDRLYELVVTEGRAISF